MSVRATERLVGDLVTVTSLPNSPNMVVQSVEIDTKMVVTAWFANNGEYQEGCFPANALDRVDTEKAKKTVKSAAKPAAKAAKAKPKGKRK